MIIYGIENSQKKDSILLFITNSLDDDGNVYHLPFARYGSRQVSIKREAFMSGRTNFFLYLKSPDFFMVIVTGSFPDIVGSFDQPPPRPNLISLPDCIAKDKERRARNISPGVESNYLERINKRAFQQLLCMFSGHTATVSKGLRYSAIDVIRKMYGEDVEVNQISSETASQLSSLSGSHYTLSGGHYSTIASLNGR